MLGPEPQGDLELLEASELPVTDTRLRCLRCALTGFCSHPGGPGNGHKGETRNKTENTPQTTTQGWVGGGGDRDE